MKVLGIQTDDFSAYHDLVQLLRERNLRFLSLHPSEDVPAHVGVVITTSSEASHVRCERVVVYTTPEETLASATRALAGLDRPRRCVIGIDPGERPGVAVLADGRPVHLAQAASPEAVRDAIVSALETVPAERHVVRLGDGAPTFRDRILAALEDLGVPVELVDETRSTPVNPRGSAHRDIAAAASIALTRGTLLPLPAWRPVRPTDGELRDIQRKSRLASDGRVTISRALARDVALGHLTLHEAVERQREKPREAPDGPEVLGKT